MPTCMKPHSTLGGKYPLPGLTDVMALSVPRSCFLFEYQGFAAPGSYSVILCCISEIESPFHLKPLSGSAKTMT